jgi:hypothetical protein
LGTKLIDAGEIGTQKHVQDLALAIGQLTVHTLSIALRATMPLPISG